MKFVSWNVNGLRAVMGKGFAGIFDKLRADFFCLQETKIQEGQCDLQFEGYRTYLNCAERKGYSGTAIISSDTAAPATFGIGRSEHDTEGRVITLDIGHCFLVTVYTPNSRAELVRLDYRMDWEKAFAGYLMELDSKKPVVVCGDLNVAHRDIDIANPSRNRRNPGFTDEERSAFQRLLDAGFVDSYRFLHPDAVGAYTWWSYRFNSRAKNLGWRIDYFLVSSRLSGCIKQAGILSEITGSDHCPVTLELEF